jgi:hypothetical protein
MLFLIELVVWTWSAAPDLSYGFHITCKLITISFIFVILGVILCVAYHYLTVWSNVLSHSHMWFIAWYALLRTRNQIIVTSVHSCNH